MKEIMFNPQDYTFTVTKEFAPLPQEVRFRLSLSGEKEHSEEVLYKVNLVEFDESFYVDELKDAEKEAYEKIAEKLGNLDHSKIPIPIKYNDNFSGKISLRISPQVHKKIWLEAKLQDISLNKLIEKKLYED